ncbi:DUF1656 domain-containing protein [Paracoccus sp. MBLB3053]|uniref:DUF1656 domain-containing protein n=1 Tax=Paracoccus aurantius TaxID=3073814 RepID=A0ABU2HZZ3_9RHOB|nr:DUF1656 domain-containing protein [Paracoccus sp. MBLB3053]MDS9470184.1 DUF1656 domain-containing protein [Paracoccus sp. MBLB3053]
MMHQIDLYGVFIPTLAVLALGAALVHFPLRRALTKLGFYRFVWHRPLFDLALYICILGVGLMILKGTAS